MAEDLGDKEDVKNRTKRTRDLLAERKDAVSAILRMPGGRKWIFEIMEYCGIFQSPFATNALIMAHSSGRGDVGRKILADITDTDPSFFVLMLKEKELENGRDND